VIPRPSGWTSLLKIPLVVRPIGCGFPLSPDHRKVGILALTNEAEIWVMENLVAVLTESGARR